MASTRVSKTLGPGSIPGAVAKRVKMVEKIDSKTYAEDLIFRLQERARIRRQIPTRKSVQEGKPDRISDLLEEAAVFIQLLKDKV